jgi:hypothetical protein
MMGRKREGRNFLRTRSTEGKAKTGMSFEIFVGRGRGRTYLMGLRRRRRRRRESWTLCCTGSCDPEKAGISIDF